MKILNDSNNEIFIMILNDQIIGMMQLTFIPGLSMQGITRCQIESVRIKKEYRDRGYGSKLINKSIEIAKRKKEWKPRTTNHNSGSIWKYAQTVGPAHEGAVTQPGAKEETHTYADI